MTFKQALKEIIDNGTYERIIKTTKGKDRTNAKVYYNCIKDNKDFDNEQALPTFILIQACQSYTVLQNIIFTMAYEKELEDSKQKASEKECQQAD